MKEHPIENKDRKLEKKSHAFFKRPSHEDALDVTP
jgi:hypothetical protein